jgi:hypothetical protein
MLLWLKFNHTGISTSTPIELWLPVLQAYPLTCRTLFPCQANPKGLVTATWLEYLVRQWIWYILLIPATKTPKWTACRDAESRDLSRKGINK